MSYSDALRNENVKPPPHKQARMIFLTDLCLPIFQYF